MLGDDGTMAVAWLLLGMLGLAVLDQRLWYRSRRRAERRLVPVKTSAGWTRCLDVGPRDGEVVLFSSGGGAGIDVIAALDWLPAAGYRIVSVARPGYHGTPVDPAAGLTDHARMYRDALEELGIERPHVLGVSAGGPSALHLAASMPVRSLVLWSAITGPYRPDRAAMDSPLGRLILSPRGQDVISWLLSRSARLAPAATMRQFLTTESSLDGPAIRQLVTEELASPGSRRAFRTLVDATTPMSRLFTGMMSEVRLMEAPWAPGWSAITCPVLAAASEVDRDVPLEHLERVQRHLPDATIIRVRAGGHFVWWGAEGHALIRRTVEFLHAASRA